MFAVIKTGGKQYRVSEGTVLTVEKIDGKAGEDIVIPQVLLLENDKQVQLGSPYLENVSVVGEIIGQERNEKVIAFKKRRRQNSKRTRGHRQHVTRLRIKQIVLDSKKS